MIRPAATIKAGNAKLGQLRMRPLICLSTSIAKAFPRSKYFLRALFWRRCREMRNPPRLIAFEVRRRPGWGRTKEPAKTDLLPYAPVTHGHHLVAQGRP